MRLLLVFSCIVSYGAFAQSEHFWAIPAPNTLIGMHHSADSTSGAVAQVSSDDVLLVRCEGGPWCSAQDQRGRKGFVRRALISPLTTFDDSSATEWIQKVFERQRYLGERMNALHRKDSIALHQYGDSLNDHDLVHIAALSLFEPYYCRTANGTLLHDFMRSVAANPGSASEEPLNKLAAAFRCEPIEFKKVLRSLAAGEQEFVLGATSTGLWLAFDERDPVRKAERDKLLRSLNEN